MGGIVVGADSMGRMASFSPVGILRTYDSSVSNLHTLTYPLPHHALTLPLYTPGSCTPSHCCPVFSLPNCTLHISPLPPPYLSVTHSLPSSSHLLSALFPLLSPPSLSLHHIPAPSPLPSPHSPLPLTNLSPLFLTPHTLSPPHPLSLNH